MYKIFHIVYQFYTHLFSSIFQRFHTTFNQCLFVSKSLDCSSVKLPCQILVPYSRIDLDCRNAFKSSRGALYPLRILKKCSRLAAFFTLHSVFVFHLRSSSIHNPSSLQELTLSKTQSFILIAGITVLSFQKSININLTTFWDLTSFSRFRQSFN